MGLFSSISKLFHHVEKDAVHQYLPFLEGAIGKFFAASIPIGETLVEELIKNKGSISDADRNAAAIQLRDIALKTVDKAAADAGGSSAVTITDGIAKLLLDTAYQKLKLTGKVIPTGSTANVGIAITKVDPATAIVGPAAPAKQ